MTLEIFYIQNCDEKILESEACRHHWGDGEMKWARKGKSEEPKKEMRKRRHKNRNIQESGQKGTIKKKRWKWERKAKGTVRTAHKCQEPNSGWKKDYSGFFYGFVWFIDVRSQEGQKENIL